MVQKTLLLLFATLLAGPSSGQWTTAPVSAPRVQYRTFQSSAANTTVSYHVWTPPAYDTEPNRRFPTLYWLHGSGSPTAPIAPLSQWFADAMGQGLIPPMLIVFPNGMPYGMWTNSKDGLVPMETVVISELIPEVDVQLRTIAAREARIVEGFSMGGQGAGRFAFKHSNVFGAASMLGAGPLQLDFMDEPPCSTTPLSLRQQIYQSVWGSDPAYYLANTPWTLATQNANTILASNLRLRMATGQLDCMLANHTALHQHLVQLAIPHSWSTPPGIDHNALALLQALGAANWDFYRSALAPQLNGSSFCLGDGSALPCPCGNASLNGGGCASSLGVGARLAGYGSTSLLNDTLTLEVYPVPNTTLIFFQGVDPLNNGAGEVFGDGLRCVGGVLTRLGTKQAIANFAQYSSVVDAPISVRGQVPVVGGTRYYQVWYRNPDPTWCTPQTTNLSNSWAVTWTP